MISLRDIVFRYREKAKRNILDHVSLDLEEGKLTVIMGASGCGKSTLAAVMAGLYPENGGFLECGQVLMDGMDLLKLTPEKRAPLLTVMFQNPDLQFCMQTLRAEMRFCLENLSVPREQMDKRIEQAAAEMGMTAYLDRQLLSLSGGEKQRAALCCLFCMESRCIVLDEPFANIDPDNTAGLVKQLQQLRDMGRTIIVIDHRPEFWTEAANEFIILQKGGQVRARGFDGSSLAEFEAVFQEQGLFFPREEKRHRKDLTGAEPAIQLEQVNLLAYEKKRRFSRAPVKMLQTGLNASFPKGHITAILGHSGCGKTTLFSAILNQHPSTGMIRINGTRLKDMKPAELYRQIGIVFQNPANQFITQNVLEEVEGSLRLWTKDLGEEECRSKALALLEEYDLAGYQKYSPYMLSQGQQRRLAVLSVLCGGQQILFLDEPTYGQDLRSASAIMEQLRRKVQEEGLTVVLITHDRAMAMGWADKIYRMSASGLEEVTGE